MNKVDRFDPGLGIQNILDMPEPENLPRARQLASTEALVEPGLEELYAATNARSAVEAMLCPGVGDGSCVSPGVFSSALQQCASALENSAHPEVREMVEKELRPLLLNEQVLQAYLGLVVGG